MTTEVVMPTVTDDEMLNIIAPYEETDDPHKRTHIVNPPDNPHISHGRPDMEAQEVVNAARMLGLEIKALCGYRFVPKYNPERFESCSACIKIAGDIMRELGE